MSSYEFSLRLNRGPQASSRRFRVRPGSDGDLMQEAGQPRPAVRCPGQAGGHQVPQCGTTARSRSA